TDGSGSTIHDDFRLTVVNTNDAPVVNAALPDRSVNEDAPLTFSTANNFTDPDAGNTLTYTARLTNGAALPSWLTFTAGGNTVTFSGTPANATVGFTDVRVTATDTSGASVYDDFRITVVNTNDAPTVTLPLADQTAVAGRSFSYAIPSGSFTDV